MQDQPTMIQVWQVGWLNKEYAVDLNHITPHHTLTKKNILLFSTDDMLQVSIEETRPEPYFVSSVRPFMDVLD